MLKTITKKLSLIFVALLTIVPFSTSCALPHPTESGVLECVVRENGVRESVVRKNGVREYFGHTHAEYLTALTECENEIEAFDFSVLSIDLDGDPSVTESEYVFHAVCEWSSLDYDDKSFILANSEIILYLNDAEISDSEIKIKLWCEHRPNNEDNYLIPSGSAIDLAAIDTDSEDYYEDSVDKYYEYYDNDVCLGEKRYEFVYPYSIVANGKSYGTIKFSCAEELSEEKLEKICELFKNNIVIVEIERQK